MNALLGTLTIAAAIAGTLANAHTASAEPVATKPQGEEPRGAKTADPLDPEPRMGEHELKTGAMTKLCDIRCQVLHLTEETIPGLGASEVLYTVLYPGKVGLSIPKADGTVAVTFTVMPTQLARGKGLVAMGTF